MSFLMICCKGGLLQCGVYAEVCSMWAFCKLLSDTTCGRSHKLTACPDKAIYGWRGLTKPCNLAKTLAGKSSEPSHQGVALAVGLPAGVAHPSMGMK